MFSEQMEASRSTSRRAHELERENEQLRRVLARTRELVALERQRADRAEAAARHAWQLAAR